MIIVSVAVSIRTSRFEYSRVIDSPIGAPAGFGGAVTSCTTVFVGMESVARGVAGDYLGAIVITDLQFRWTEAVDVVAALGFFAAVLTAVALSINWLDLE